MSFFTAFGLLLIIVLAIIGGVLYMAIVSQKRSRAEKQSLTLALGFRPVETPEEALVSQLLEFHSGLSSQVLQVRNFFTREEADCQVYLFDLWDISGRSSSVEPLHSNSVAVVSDKLNLPRFSIFPKLPGSGKLSKFGNVLLEKFALGNNPTIANGNNSRFSREYFLAGADESEIRKVVTDDLMDRISQRPYRQIEAGRNMFTYDRIRLLGTQQEPKESEVEGQVAEALDLFHLLRPGRHGSS